MRILRILLLILSIPFAVLLLLYGYGLTKPENHSASVTRRVAAPAGVVWKAVTDYSAMPGWWSAVARVTFETDASGKRITVNEDSHGRKIGFYTVEEVPEKKLVRRIVDGGPFGGTWTYEFSNDNGGTVITITEDGWIKPPLFRAFASMRGHTATMTEFLDALEKFLARGP